MEKTRKFAVNFCLTKFAAKRNIPKKLVLLLMMLPLLAFAQNGGGLLSVSKQRLYDKEIEKQDFIKKLLKSCKAKTAVVEEWQDGTLKYVLTPKKGTGYIIYNYDIADEKQPRLFGSITDVKMLVVDNKTYYHGFSSYGYEYLVRQNGESVLNSAEMKNIEIKNFGGKSYISYNTGNFNNISDMNGKNIHYGSLPVGAKWVNAIQKGYTYSTLNGEKIKFYTQGTKGYFTNDMHSNVDENGKEIEGMRYYTQLLDGYSGLLYYPYSIKGWKKDKIPSKFGRAGETDNILRPVPEENRKSLNISISTANGDELFKDLFVSEEDIDKFYYNIDEQAFHYSSFDYKAMRTFERVISLRDSSLNIPAMFREAGYMREGDELTPYVRRTMLASVEPYVAGMDSAARYGSVGEEKIEERNYFGAYEYYRDLPADHKWSFNDVMGMNMAVVLDRESWLKKGYEVIDGYESGKYDGKNIEESAIRLDAIKFTTDDYTIKWIYSSTKDKDDKIAASTKDAKVKECAEMSSGLMSKMIDIFKGICQGIEQAEKDYSDRKEQAELDRQIAEAERRQRLAEQAERQRQQNAQTGIAIMQAVGNTLHGIFGGGKSSSKSSGYSGSSYSGGAVSGGTSSGSSSGSKLVTCSACGGTGKCNACRPYPGYASRGSTKPCKGCGGKVTCQYCGGAGKVRR